MFSDRHSTLSLFSMLSINSIDFSVKNEAVTQILDFNETFLSFRIFDSVEFAVTDRLKCEFVAKLGISKEFLSVKRTGDSPSLVKSR